MNDRKFLKILIITVLIGAVITAAHLIYICLAYQNSSVVQFIAREMWL